VHPAGGEKGRYVHNVLLISSLIPAYQDHLRKYVQQRKHILVKLCSNKLTSLHILATLHSIGSASRHTSSLILSVAAWKKKKKFRKFFGHFPKTIFPFGKFSVKNRNNTYPQERRASDKHLQSSIVVSSGFTHQNRNRVIKINIYSTFFLLHKIHYLKYKINLLR
jgi:hypothetical protein